MRARDGYMLSSERLWLRRRSTIIVQAMHMEAAARLALFREDFDVKHVDAFCLSLLGTDVFRVVCDWILNLCRELLDPREAEVMRKQSTVKRLSLSLVNRVSHYGDGDLWLQASSQDARFAYFRSKLCKLQIWREDDCALLDELKAVVDEFMSKIGQLCTVRFKQLLAEPQSGCLKACHQIFYTRLSARVADQAVLFQFHSIHPDSLGGASLVQERDEDG